MSKSRCNWSSPLILLALAAPVCGQQLAVEDITIGDFEGGIGVPSSYEFSTGEKAHLAFRIRGFGRSEPDRKVNLSYTIEAVDCHGQPLAPAHTGQIERRLGAGTRNWAPALTYAIEIPPVPRAGTHNFHIRVKDAIAGTETSAEAPFEVQSPFDDPAETLSVQQFRFFRSEREEKPIEGEPVFHPGEAVWGRFFLTGFRTAQNNSYDLKYGVSLRTPAGRTIFNEEVAASEARESFYPKTHVAGVINVALERSIRPGLYFVVIAGSDAVGNQQFKAEYRFRVSE